MVSVQFVAYKQELFPFFTCAAGHDQTDKLSLFSVTAGWLFEICM